MSLAGLPPIMLTTHGLFFHTDDLRRIEKAHLRTVSRVTLARVRETFAVSASDYAVLRSVGVESTLLHNGVVPYPRPGARGHALLYVGRMSAGSSPTSA